MATNRGDRERKTPDRDREIFNEVDQLLSSLPVSAQSGSDSEFRRAAMESIGRQVGLPIDGRVELQESVDAMGCFAHFYPPLAGGSIIELSGIEDLIARARIVFGIDWNAVREALLRCNTEGHEVTDVLIAKGQAPIAAVPGHFEIERRLIEPPAPTFTETDRVDHRSRSPYVLVKRGDRIASRTEDRSGTVGRDIHGVELVPAEVPIHPCLPGTNTREEEDGIYAACDGRFVMAGTTVSVSPILEVSADVDYSTGNINFDGDVVVGGSVKEGFQVRCAGSLHVHSMLEATRVECGGDLVVGRGIIGKHDGYVRAGGSVTCHYIENCYVEAAGTISAPVGSLNAVVNTLDRFETSAKGVIVGGKIVAQNGVRAGQIGTATGPATEVCCGIDYTILGKLERVRDESLKVAARLNEVKRELKSRTNASIELNQTAHRLQQAMHQLNDASITLVGQLDKNETATITANEIVHPNTYFEICHVSYVVSSPLRRVLLRLDKTLGVIAVTPLR